MTVFLTLGPLQLQSAEKYYEGKTVKGHYALTNTKHVDSEHINWTPDAEDKTRFMFEIPIEGLKAAKRYEDSAALYYLSSAHDLGLSFSGTDAVLVSVSSGAVELDWLRASPSRYGRFSVGVAYNRKTQSADETLFSVGYTSILQKKILVSTKIESIPSEVKNMGVGATFLNNAETIQYSGWLEGGINNNSYYAFRLAKFGVWQDVDSSVKFSESKEGLFIAPAIHKDIGAVKSSLGLEWSAQSNGMEVFIELSIFQKTRKGTLIKVRGETASSRTFPRWMDDLKPLRRKGLEQLWRGFFSFGHNEGY